MIYRSITIIGKSSASIISYRNSIYSQEPYYQLMRQTLWAEQVINNKSSEKIKADSFVNIHVVTSQNKELLDECCFKPWN